jgi:putative ATPase
LVQRLEALSAKDLRSLVRRALADPDRGLGALLVDLEPAAEELLVRTAQGDARRALNLLEASARVASPAADGRRTVDFAALSQTLQSPTLYHDAGGDWHYDVVSALIKSLRGSDPDAALYWLARMVEAGEDPLFIARRLVIFASEDVGNADPRALLVAVAAAQALEHVGLPEARLNLAQAAIYLARAPKSNAVITAIGAALRDVRELGATRPPKMLRDPHYPGAKRLGHGEGYRYPHDDPGGFEVDHLPEELQGRVYYRPSGNGEEGESP